MTAEDWLTRARRRVQIDLRRNRLTGYYFLVMGQGPPYTLPVESLNEALQDDEVYFLCTAFGLDPVDFELDAWD